MMSQSFKQWLNYYGYQWVEGREELIKGDMGPTEAEEEVQRLWREGAVKRRDV